MNLRGLPSQWFWDTAVVNQLPAWIRIYVRYARFRGKDGRRVLSSVQWVSRRLRWKRVGSAQLREVVICVDLYDRRFPWVLGEVRGPSLQRFAIEQLLESGDLFVDVGANHGSFSLLAAKVVGEAGCVHAIEPNGWLAGLIERSVELNGFPQVHVHNCAASADQGFLSLRIDRNSGSSVVGDPNLVSEVAGLGMVRSRTIDEIVQTSGCSEGVVLIKIDVEGHELACLDGAVNVVKDRSPYVLVEVSPVTLGRVGLSPTRLIERLCELGYRRFTDGYRWPLTFGVEDVHVDRQYDLLAIPDGTERWARVAGRE